MKEKYISYSYQKEVLNPWDWLVTHVCIMGYENELLTTIIFRYLVCSKGGSRIPVDPKKKKYDSATCHVTFLSFRFSQQWWGGKVQASD